MEPNASLILIKTTYRMDTHGSLKQYKLCIHAQMYNSGLEEGGGGTVGGGEGRGVGSSKKITVQQLLG